MPKWRGSIPYLAKIQADNSHAMVLSVSSESFEKVDRYFRQNKDLMKYNVMTDNGVLKEFAK